jgi:catalase
MLTKNLGAQVALQSGQLSLLKASTHAYRLPHRFHRRRELTMASPTPRRGSYLMLLPIAGIVGAIALAFAWNGGWIGSDQLKPQDMIKTAESTGSPLPGFRRAHSKGVCFAGTFTPTPQAAALSTARVFTQPSTAFIGRFSAPGNNPYAPDAKAPVRGMAVQLKTDDGQEWRVAMNSFPFFAVSSPEGFNALNQAMRPDPATGKPDPEKVKAVVAQHPEILKFQAWSKTAPVSDSFGNTRFNGVNAFRLIDAKGAERAVRWSMRPRLPVVALSPEQLAKADANFLSEDLAKRLASGPVLYDMVMQFAAPGDPVTDPTKAWPETRPETTVGTFSLTQSGPQVSGPCRDINFDPLILPKGIAGTDDPILHARSSVYSVSFNRREREISSGKALDATGQKESTR